MLIPITDSWMGNVGENFVFENQWMQVRVWEEKERKIFWFEEIKGAASDWLICEESGKEMWCYWKGSSEQGCMREKR